MVVNNVIQKQSWPIPEAAALQTLQDERQTTTSTNPRDVLWALTLFRGIRNKLVYTALYAAMGLSGFLLRGPYRETIGFTLDIERSQERFQQRVV